MPEEVFLDHPWQEDHIAQQQRDIRRQELQAQGRLCTTLDLWNVQGQRIYLLISSEDIVVLEPNSSQRQPSSRSTAGRSRQPRSISSSRPQRRLL